MKSQCTLNAPSDFGVKGELGNKAIASAIVFQSVPRCKKILGFDAHQMVSPLGFISDYFRVTHHQALTASVDDGRGNLTRFFSVGNRAAFGSQNNFVSIIIGKHHALKPISNSIRKVKGNEAAGISEHAMTNCFHGLNITTTSAPNLTIQRNAAGQSIKKASRSLDNVSVASPEVVAIPERAASVVFFRPKPSGAIPEVPVPSQCHCRFVHGKNISTKIGTCLVEDYAR